MAGRPPIRKGECMLCGRAIWVFLPKTMCPRCRQDRTNENNRICDLARTGREVREAGPRSLTPKGLKLVQWRTITSDDPPDVPRGKRTS